MRTEILVFAIMILVSLFPAKAGAQLIDLQANVEAKAAVKVDGVEKDSVVKAKYEASATETEIEAWSGVAEAEHIEDGEMLQAQSYSYVVVGCVSKASQCEVEASHVVYTYSEVPTLPGKTTGGDSSAASQGVAGQDVAMANIGEGMIGVSLGRMNVYANVNEHGLGGVWHMGPTYTCEFAGGQYLTAQWNGLCWVVHSYLVRSEADALDGNKRTYDIDFVATEDLSEGEDFYFSYSEYQIMPMYARVNGVGGWRDKKLRSESHAPADPPQTESVHVTVSGSARTRLVASWEVSEE